MFFYYFSEMAIFNTWVYSGIVAMVTLTAVVMTADEEAENWSEQSGSSRLNELANIDKALLARYLADMLSRNPSYDSPIPPGSTLQAKLQSYINAQSPMAKRDGYWVWMPAQGFVPIPKQNGVGSSKSASHTKILRYG